MKKILLGIAAILVAIFYMLCLSMEGAEFFYYIGFGALIIGIYNIIRGYFDKD